MNTRHQNTFCFFQFQNEKWITDAFSGKLLRSLFALPSDESLLISMADRAWLESSLLRSARLGRQVLDRASRRTVDWTNCPVSRSRGTIEKKDAEISEKVLFAHYNLTELPLSMYILIDCLHFYLYRKHAQSLRMSLTALQYWWGRWALSARSARPFSCTSAILWSGDLKYVCRPRCCRRSTSWSIAQVPRAPKSVTCPGSTPSESHGVQHWHRRPVREPALHRTRSEMVSGSSCNTNPLPWYPVCVSQ